VAHRLTAAIAAIAVALVAYRPAKAGHDLRSEAHAYARAEAHAPAIDAQREEAGSPRSQAPLTILQINDVYSTVPVDGMGGLARVATLKRQVAAAGRTPLLMIAGDFLSSSVASTVFQGEQMIAALNAAGLDMATLGNHEFDFGDDVLIQRMREAKWTWLVSNVIDTRTNKPIGGAAPYVLRTFGHLKVGFIGLCLDTSEISALRLTHSRVVHPLDAAAQYMPILKREGANVIVALTHLAFTTDRELVEKFPEIDVVIGGHEHYPITTTENRTLISKAGSDAKWVARIDINRVARGDGRHDGTLERFFELIPVTDDIPDEPATAAVVNDYESRLSPALEVVVGTARVPLDAGTVRLRAGETNLGDVIADAMRASAGADIAILNSGGIRGDRIFAAGPLTKRSLLEMLPFGNVVCKIAAPGRVILAALNHGVSKLPASAGQFPQVSGLTMTVDANRPASDRVTNVRVADQPLDPNRTYTVALPDFLLKGGDGYSMWSGQRVLVDAETGDLMVSVLEKYVADKVNVTQTIDGRITVLR
jgi:5'-nucleotidase / UDP-sugar diphosphatase